MRRALRCANFAIRTTIWILLAGLSACGDEEDTPAGDASANGAPTISGAAPGTALVGVAYSFQPAASDPDGDALQFNATGLPAWASIDPSTGRISGTPEAGEEGTYGQIALTVSDGTASAALTPFAITVAQSVSGSATLSWLPPTDNCDGTVLTDLSGYRIQYGRSAGNLDQSIEVENPSINTYVVEQLAPGTWYFAVVARNARHIESLPSNLGSKTIG